MRINLKRYVPEKSASGFDFRVKGESRCLDVWYRVDCKHGGYKDVRCKIPKFIETDDLFWESLGILQGEMKKSVKNLGYANISFSNSNVDIVNHVLDFFQEFFNIERCMWRATAGYNTKGIKIHNKNEFGSNIVTFWHEKTKLPVDNFTKINLNPRYRTRSATMGHINVKYCNAAFSSFFLNLLEKIKAIIENDEDASKAYLRGLFAAEGSPFIRKGFLNSVELGVSRNEDYKHYKKCLIRAGISGIKRGKTQIKIYGWDNFYKLYKTKIFRLHRQRELKFINGFMKSHNTRKILLLNELIKPKKMNDLDYKKIRLARRTIQQHFTNLFKMWFTNRQRIFNKDGSWYYIWSISSKGETVRKNIYEINKTKAGCEKYVV